MGDVYPIRLVVQRQDTGYQARWVEEGGQESASFDLQLPLSDEDAAELRWYLEKFYTFVGPGTQERARGVERRIETWGLQLFEACFGGSEGTHVYRNLLEAVKAGRQVLLALGSAESRFLQQPWELMRRPWSATCTGSKRSSSTERASNSPQKRPGSPARASASLVSLYRPLYAR